jgi:uncharacterized protein YcaQ
VTLSPTLARRLAVTRQRLAGPQAEATPAGLLEVIRAIGCVQLDPIRAVERTQYLVLWSRVGPYDPAHLDTLLWQERKLFEYWGHAASIVLTEDYPLHEPLMRRLAQGNSNHEWTRRAKAWLNDNDAFRQHILDRLRQDGSLSAAQIEDLAVRPWTSGGWTANNPRNVTQILSLMWDQGDIMVAGRKGLQKKWALTEQWLPEWANHQPWSDRDVVRQAAQRSLRALGVGTARHITNHFIRNRYPELETALAELVVEGRIIPASIGEGGVTWPGRWYIHADDLPLLEALQAGTWQPRTTLLSPFDNLICDRDRTELMWDFYFRIEIYVPKAKRQYGYYVLPILHGDRLIGRIDPSMDRKTGKLNINAVYAEPDAPQDPETAQAIAAAIAELALFLKAKEIVYGETIPAGWRKAIQP